MQSGALVGHTVAGRFHVTRLLGEGAMGEVYVAQHTVLDQPFALKILKAHVARDKNLSERFRREAQVASRLDHPNIVYISDFGQMENGQLYLVMEYIDGQSLREAIHQALPGRMPLLRSLDVLKQLSRALDHAHRTEIVHRDIKPDNVLLGRRPDGGDQVKILDFGLAKILDSHDQLTRRGDLFGSPMYMSPEQCRGEPVDHRADVYSLGILAYEIFTGRVPFNYPSIPKMIMAQINEPVPRPTQVLPAGEDVLPPELESFVMRCLEKDRDDRPTRASEFAGVIDAFLAKHQETIDAAKAKRAPPPVPEAVALARVSDELPGVPSMLVAANDAEAMRQWYWNQLCKAAEELAGWLIKRGKASPELSQALGEVNAREEEELALQTDLALEVSALADLDEETRLAIAQLRHAVVDLRVERDRADEQSQVNHDVVGDMDFQIQHLETRLAEVYTVRRTRVRAKQAELDRIRETLHQKRQSLTDYERRLIGLVRWEKPQPCPPATSRKYKALEAMVMHLYGEAS